MFILCGLYIINSTNLLPKATTNLRQEFAANELEFTKPIYDTYIKNVPDLASTYGPVLTSATIGAMDARSFCSGLTMLALNETQLTPENKYLNFYLNKVHKSATFPQVQDHTAGVMAFDCLIGINVARQAIPKDKLASLLIDLNAMAKNIISYYNGDVLRHYKNKASGNPGDTPAEESVGMAVFYEGWSLLAPSVGPGSITQLERQKYHQLAKDLWTYSFSQCASDCPFKPGTWMVNNHQYFPNPHYTQSVLMSATELAMLYNQVSAPVPDTLFTPDIKTKIAAISRQLETYIAPNFSYTGPYTFKTVSGQTIFTGNYGNQTYSLSYVNKRPITSSIPTDHIRAANFHMIPNTNMTKAYILSNDTLWHYMCDTNQTNPCRAQYEKFPSKTQWQSMDQQGAWAGFPLPTSFSGHTGWYYPGTSTLYSTLWGDDKVWQYTCDSSGCKPYKVQSIASYYPANYQISPVWSGNLPPTSNIDSVSQFVYNNELKTYVFKGNRYWHFVCSISGTTIGSCIPKYTLTLSEFWTKIRPVEGKGWTDVPFPTDTFDAVTQFVDSSNTIKSYVFKNDHVWAYNCNNGVCQALYGKTLWDFFEEIDFQHAWPNLKDPTMKGITDWAMDATTLNSGIAARYIVNGNDYVQYQKLLQEETNRSLKSRPPMPVNYQNGEWNYQPITKLFPREGVGQLLDGYKVYDVNTGKVHTSSGSDRLYMHTWTNIFTGRNHAYSYLALTDTKYLGEFLIGDQTVEPTVISANQFTLPADQSIQMVGSNLMVNIRGVDTLPAQSAATEFTINKAGKYLIQAKVKAVDTSTNSVYVSIDKVPSALDIWDVNLLTVGYADRFVSNRGNGTFDKPQYDPWLVYLTAGKHKIYIANREVGTSINDLRFIRISD